MPVLVNTIGLGATRAEDIANIAGGAATGILQPGGDKTKQIVMSTPSIVGGVLTAGGKSSIAAAAWGTAAIPIIGAAVAGVTVGLMLLFARKGPKQKVATTQIVDQVEPKLQENLKAYFEGPRTVESQQQALNNFDAGWAFILDQCGNPEMGEPGQRCISERQRGGSAPWCPTSTGCDWFTLYRDPIANDAPVATSPSSSILNLFGSGSGANGEGGSMFPWLVGAGLVGAALLL